MYEKFFDDNRQAVMRNYFLNELSTKGIKKKYKKNEPITIDYDRYVAIVVKGMVSQYITSMRGYQKQLFLIRPGEIFGEMPYFCGGGDSIANKVKEDAEVSILCVNVLENELSKNPHIYRHFIHSLTRKFRIIMLQLTSATFNDSIGRVADALLRLNSCSEAVEKKHSCLGIVFTQQELADNIGCSRITITRCLNKLEEEGIIAYEERKIVIKHPEVLASYIDSISED